MPPALARLWAEAAAAGADDEAAALGGRWSPTSVWHALEELRMTSPMFAALLQAEAAPRL